MILTVGQCIAKVSRKEKGYLAVRSRRQWDEAYPGDDPIRPQSSSLCRPSCEDPRYGFLLYRPSTDRFFVVSDDGVLRDVPASAAPAAPRADVRGGQGSWSRQRSADWCV